MVDQSPDLTFSKRRVFLISVAISIMLSNLFFLATMQILPSSVYSRFILPIGIFIIGGIYAESIPHAIYAALLSVSLFIGCSDKTETDLESLSESDLIVKGKEIFYMNSEHNNISCADCHSDGTNDNKPLTKFFSDVKAANERPSTYLGKFKGEEVARNAGGATVCRNHYQLYKTDFNETEIKSLNAFFSSLKISEEDLLPKEYSTIALPERDKQLLRDEQSRIMQLTGNLESGREIFNDACATCHSADSKIGKVPSLKDDFEGNIKGVIFMTRLGDGAMPFYSNEKLSDQQIADLSAFIMSLKN